MEEIEKEPEQFINDANSFPPLFFSFAFETIATFRDTL